MLTKILNQAFRSNKILIQVCRTKSEFTRKDAVFTEHKFCRKGTCHYIRKYTQDLYNSRRDVKYFIKDRFMKKQITKRSVGSLY